MLPILLGGTLLVLVIFFVCLWRRLSIVQRVLVCRCCHCHDQIPDPAERIVESTETSVLISNQADNRAVAHDFLGAKVEDGDLGRKYKFPGKDDRTVVV